MKFFEKNESEMDRAIRGVLGIGALAAIWIAPIQPPLAYLAALLGIGLLFTAITGSCTLYTLMGVRTCPVKKK